MRNKSVFHLISTVVLATPLLFACDSSGTGGGGGGGGGGGPTLPATPCTATQALTTNSAGNFVCQNLPSGMVNLPTCDPNTQAVTTDGTNITCTARNTSGGDATTITTDLTTINSQVTDYGTQLNGLATGPGAKAVYVGSTTATTVGKMTYAGADTGLNAAAAMCNAQFAGSHMCHVYEMYNTVVAGKLHAGTTIPKSWLFMPSWKAPASSGGLPGTEDTPFSGSADNCGSATYPTADRKWTGMAVEWTTLSTGFSGFKFWGGSMATCHDTYPVACCK